MSKALWYKAASLPFTSISPAIGTTASHIIRPAVKQGVDEIYNYFDY